MDDFSRYSNKRGLEDVILASIEWIKNNRQQFFSIAGTTVFFVILIIFFFVRLHSTRVRAEDKLAYAQANFYQGKVQEGINIFDEIISQYPGTPANYKSRLQKASYLLEMRQYDEAEKIILPATLEGKPKTIVPLAMSVLGAIYENAGKYKEAISTYNSFLDKFPEHFFASKIYESLARVQEASGATQDAKTTYEKITALYPGSAWAQRSQERLASIASTQAAQTNTNK